MKRDRRAARLRTVFRSTARGLVGIVVVLVIWQAVAGLGIVSQSYFPPASAVLAYAIGLVAEPDFLYQTGVMLASMFIGLGIAIVVAVPIGSLLGMSRIAYRMVTLLVEIMRPIPALALAPLAILLFGLSVSATTSLVVWTAVWPILVNSIYGMHQVDPVAIDTARSFGMRHWAIIRSVALPSGAPFIAMGIRVSIGVALAVAVAAEMVAGSGNGLGGWILQASSGGSLLPVYAAAVLVGILGYLLNRLVESGEKRLFPWHESHRGEAAR